MESVFTDFIDPSHFLAAFAQLSQPRRVYRTDRDLEYQYGVAASQIVNRMPLSTIELVAPKLSSGEEGMDYFRDSAKQECLNRWPFLEEHWEAVSRRCDIHHKRFKCMGKSNLPDNLLFLDRAVHKEIHFRHDPVLKRGDDIMTRHQGSPTLLLDWVKNDRDLSPMKEELCGAGFSFNENGKICITLPSPAETVIIPRFLFYNALECPGYR